MTPTPEVQERLRRYLLGQLADGVREQIEKDLLANDELFEELLTIEDEIIDDYLGERLNASDRATFENHFLATPERHEQLRFGRALNRYLSQAGPAPSILREPVPSTLDRQQIPDVSTLKATPTSGPWAWTQKLFSSRLREAAVAIIVLGIALGGWRIFFHQSEVDKGLLALNAAYREQRPIESRISNLDYAPYVVTRGPGDQRINLDELQHAELTLRNAQNKNSTAAVVHALGKVYLAKKDFDKAINQFNEAIKSDPKNAQLYSDLGAAWLEKGKFDNERNEQGKSAEELARSLGYLTKALELNPNLLEARFNRALCYQLMFIPPRAAEEWREYLKKDSSSPWAEEAKRRLKELEERKSNVPLPKEKLLDNFRKAFEERDDQAAWLIISRHRDLSAGPIANGLIDSYLDLAEKGQSAEAQRTLDALLYVAKLEEDHAGDLFVRDVSRFLQSSSPTQRRSLVEARRLLGLGRDALYEWKGKVAQEYLVRAKAILEKIGDKADVVYADYPIGHSHLIQLESQLSLSAFNHVVRQGESRRYRWLQAQALNASANVQIGLTNLSAALQASERSLKLSEQIGDATGVIKTTNQLAQQYFRLGNYSKSLELHQQSLAMANSSGTEPIQHWRSYFSIPFPLNAMGLHSAAIEYEKEALRWSEESRIPPVTVCRSYSLLGLMYAGDGNFDEAIKNADVALERASKISDAASRQEAIAYSSLHRGLIYQQAGNFDKAVADYDQAIRLYDELGKFQAFNYLAQKGKLLSCIDKGTCGSVEDQIRTCIDLFEGYRSKILEESNREPFFDTEQDIYDVAISYEFSRNNFQRAFEYSEQARARSLLDLTTNAAKLIGKSGQPDIRFEVSTPVRTFDEIKAELPPEAQVIQYAVLKDKLAIWLISNATFSHQEKFVALAELNEIVIRFLKAVSSPTGNAEQVRLDGAILYDILIKPIEASLRKDQILCIVPDKTLNYLPFAALISTSGKFLMDEYRLTMAPSANMFIHSSKLAAEKNKVENEKLLAVGNPRFSRELFPELQDLPSALREAEEIKRFYKHPQSRALVDAKATKALVKAGIEQADVVHFALHSIVDEQFPLRSRLVLAADRARAELDQSSVLEAYEIYESNLPVTRLVVLSSCESAVGRYYRGEGVMGLSRMFLVKVPSVVASLWAVDSDATSELMIQFHRRRTTQKFSTVEALQGAQQEMAYGADAQHRHPYYWAAFTVVGGYANF